MRNVDERFRRVFGADFGVQVETAVGLGTRVGACVPKFRRLTSEHDQPRASRIQTVARRPGRAGSALSALAVDDEVPALDELVFLLEADDRVASVDVAKTRPVPCGSCATAATTC